MSRPRFSLLRACAPLLVAVAAFVLAPASASAATVARQTVPACDSYGQTTNWGPRDLSVPKFDPSLGTLTAVTVSQQVAMRSSLTASALDNAPSTITFNVDGSVHFEVPGLTPMDAAISANRTYNYPGKGTFSDTVGPAEKYANVSIAAMGGWVGPGTVTGVARATAQATASSSGNADLSVRTSADVKFCVTYDYTVDVTVCIGDYVWEDTNENGVQDTGEAPVVGRTIVVRDASGNVLGTATTDASGHWTACNLEPNVACVVSVDLPDGWTVTGAGRGTDPARDSNGVATASGDATIACVTPPTGSDLTFDVGIIRADTPVSASSSPGKVFVRKVAGRRSIASRGTVGFVVTVKNVGATTVRDVRICDAPPQQLSFLTRPKGTFMSSGKLCWKLAALAPGKTATFRYTMRAAVVTRATCVVNAATAQTGATSGSARARTCIRPGKLGKLLLAG